MNRFNQLFTDPQNKIFMPFFTLGDPSFEKSLKIIENTVEAGVKAIELGFPFSDPIADGPTNQRSMERALASGISFDRCVEMLQIIRKRFPDLAIGLLIYYNLIYRQGEKAYQKLAQVGVDGVVCADLPLEESAEHLRLLQKYSIGAAQMIAPNSNNTRVKILAAQSSAFNYVLSGFGATGAKKELAPQTIKRIKQVRALIKEPMVVGFGISKPEHVHSVWQAGANGTIVGSYFTSIIEKNLDNIDNTVKQITDFVHGVNEHALFRLTE